MKLYKNLPGYDLFSRTEKALDRAVHWYMSDVRNTGIAIGVMLCVLFTIHGCAYAIRSLA